MNTYRLARLKSAHEHIDKALTYKSDLPGSVRALLKDAHYELGVSIEKQEQENTSDES